MPQSDVHNHSPTAETSLATATVSATARRGRVAFRLLGWILAICLAIQVFLAGLAIFDDASWWAWHRTFVHIFELLPVVLFVLSFVGQLPIRVRWLTAALFGMIAFQYATANSGGPFAALHPVNALLLFWLTTTITRYVATNAT